MERRRGFGLRGGAFDHSYKRVPPVTNDPVKNARNKFIAEMRKMLDDFWRSGKKELVLTPMNKEERKIVHVLARERDMRSHSSGKEGNRYLTVSRAKSHKYATVSMSDSFPLSLTDTQQDEIRHYLKQFTIDKDQVFKHYESPKAGHKKHNRGGILHGPPLIPPRTEPNKRFHDFRTTLPAFRLRNQIVETIDSHQVILVTGGTGCGKTTQVPQFILEEAEAHRQPIRIICTQPRRLPAIAVAERVAIERGETLGTTVGYHIRLEQKCDPRQTILTYCTSGVLLRMLTVDPMATNVTHIILDEIHEREQNTDYLLIALKEALRHRRDLKVILMSATMEGNRDTFLKYFEHNHVGSVDVPARLHRVDKFFLSDVLAMTGYLSCYQDSSIVNAFPQVGNWSDGSLYPSGYGHQLHPSASTPAFSGADPIETIANQIASVAPGVSMQSAVPPYGRQHSANSLWANGDTNGFGPMSNGWNAASPSYYEEITPSPFGSFATGFNNTARQPACHPQMVAATLKQTAAVFGDKKLHTFTSDLVNTIRRSRLPRAELVQIYQMCTGNESFLDCGSGPSVDCELVVSLIDFLMDSPIRGAILVFLPGYDDILSVKDRIKTGLNSRTVPQLFMLHSQMNSSDQHRVFDHFSNPTERKVILSTNIAEASLTIDDVVFVIDSGKAKEKTYDHETRISQLKVVSIAKSNAEQRSGRAGRCRPGYCFRLYSDDDYTNMIQTQVAEMKRAAIHDVCLHAKMFAPPGVSVKAFLGMAPEPPDAEAIDSSFTFLQQLGALFAFTDRSPFDADVEPPSFARANNVVEPDLTELGSIIAQLPLDPQLARLLLFGVALQCFNPIVTLVAALSHRDPFNLPMGDERSTALAARDDLGRRDYSDHLMLVRSYMAFMEGQGRPNVCRRYFLNLPTMRMIDGIRRQLMMELRRHNLIPHYVSQFDDPEINRYSNSWPMVQAAIVAGCYPGIGITRGGSKIKKIRTAMDNSTLLHPSSVVKRQLQFSGRREMQRFQSPDQSEAEITFLAFQELSRIDEGLTLRTVTATTPLHTLLFAGSVRMEKIIVKDFEICSEEFDYDAVEVDVDAGMSSQAFQHDYIVEIDKFLAFRAGFQILQMALKMRFKLMNYFMNWLRHPLQEMTDDNVKLLACLNKILTAELDRNNFNVVEDLPKPSTVKRSHNNRPPNTFEQPPTQKAKHQLPTQVLAKPQIANSKGSGPPMPRFTQTKTPKTPVVNGNSAPVLPPPVPPVNSSRSDSEERNCATEMLRSFIKHHQTPQPSPTTQPLASPKSTNSATTISSCIADSAVRETSKNHRSEKNNDASGQPTWNATYSNDVRNSRPAQSTGARFENRGRLLQQNKYNANGNGNNGVQQSESFTKKPASVKSDRGSESSQPPPTPKSNPIPSGRRFYNSSFSHGHHARKSESQNTPTEESFNFDNVSPPPRGDPLISSNYQNRQNNNTGRGGYRGGSFPGRRGKPFPRGGKVAPSDTAPLSNRTSSPARSNNSSSQQH
uniref:RNA helicase n=1 Tax=Panagrellus redivivus TaxID=6233 RepID=A0A7E4ZYR7_PANRE